MVLCRNLLISSKVLFLLPTNLFGSLLMALAYSRSFLRAIAPSVSEIRARCSPVLWCRLTSLQCSRLISFAAGSLPRKETYCVSRLRNFQPIRCAVVFSQLGKNLIHAMRLLSLFHTFHNMSLTSDRLSEVS